MSDQESQQKQTASSSNLLTRLAKRPMNSKTVHEEPQVVAELEQVRDQEREAKRKEPTPKKKNAPVQAMLQTKSAQVQEAAEGGQEHESSNEMQLNLPVGSTSREGEDSNEGHEGEPAMLLDDVSDSEVVAQLKSALKVTSNVDLLKSFYRNQTTALQSGICMGSPMIGTGSYLNKGVPGLLKYVSDSRLANKPLLAFTFGEHAGFMLREDMSNKYFFRVKSYNMLKAIGRSSLYYALFEALDSLIKSKKVVMTKETEMQVLKDAIIKLCGYEEIRRKATVYVTYEKDSKRIRKAEDSFSKSDRFGEECWNSIYNIFFKSTTKKIEVVKDDKDDFLKDFTL